MAQPIIVFVENYIDLDNESAEITITDSVATDNGQDIVDYMRNRSLNSAWITTGSTDAASTQIDIDMADSRDVDNILLLGHNLKNFTISTWNGVTYDTQYTGSGVTDNVTHAPFTEVSTSRVRIVITGAQTADADKYIKRLIITRQLGQFKGYPKIKAPTNTTNKKSTQMLSGKTSIIEGVGSFKCNLDFSNFFNTADLQLIEDIYRRRQGVNVWLSGGDEDQFRFAALGYRREDIFLMRPNDDYKPEYAKGIYSSGIVQTMRLVECVR